MNKQAAIGTTGIGTTGKKTHPLTIVHRQPRSHRRREQDNHHGCHCSNSNHAPQQ
ncbi:hypothetical protein Hanom_Chr07g00612591 [Helianthus anomalus]